MNKWIIFFLCGMLCAGGKGLPVNAEEQISDADSFLMQAGMKREQLSFYSYEVKQFITEDLKQAGAGECELFDLTVSTAAALANGDVLEDIWIDALAFQSGDSLYIYLMYEFTKEKRPQGRDRFYLQFGEAIRPYQYGGRIWYQDKTGGKWSDGETLEANQQGLQSAEYSGEQLGLVNQKMKIQGCASCHAVVGTGTDNRVIVGYVHDSKGEKIGIYLVGAALVSAFGLGIFFRKGLRGNKRGDEHE